MPRRITHAPAPLGIALLWLPLLGACRAQEPETKPEPPAEHALFSEQLQQTMRELDYLAGERLPQELAPAAERERRVAEIASLAQALSDSAESIPDVLADTDLPETHQEEFRALAGAMAEYANDLRDGAPGMTDAAMRDSLQKIRATCTACHGRFRVLPRVGG